MSLEALAEQGIKETLENAFHWTPAQRTLVITDDEAPLTQILTKAYQSFMPMADFHHFKVGAEEEAIAKLNACEKGDLVVLIQSANFRLNEFRVRIELFKKGIQTIEYVHLGRMSEDQFETHLNTLRYDKEYYHTMGPAIKAIIDPAQDIRVECEDTVLEYHSPMESAKLNIGDYTGMENVGGTYPIGEVFSEPQDLTKVNGEVRIFAFAGMDHCVRFYEPFKAVIKEGIMTAPDAPEEFQQTLELIRADEEVTVREFGLGLNRAIGKHSLINDVTAFERQLGLHLSLGGKHTIYKKEGLHRKRMRYHVDVFVDVKKIFVDGKIFFENGTFLLS